MMPSALLGTNRPKRLTTIQPRTFGKDESDGEWTLDLQNALRVSCGSCGRCCALDQSVEMFPVPPRSPSRPPSRARKRSSTGGTRGENESGGKRPSRSL